VLYREQRTIGKGGDIKAPLPYKDFSNVVRNYNINMKSVETANTKAQFGKWTEPEAEYKELAGSSGRSRGQTSEPLAALRP
jgi:hypothetical protein